MDIKDDIMKNYAYLFFILSVFHGMFQCGTVCKERYNIPISSGYKCTTFHTIINYLKIADFFHPNL